jgi:hypothetical protein
MTLTAGAAFVRSHTDSIDHAPLDFDIMASDLTQKLYDESERTGNDYRQAAMDCGGRLDEQAEALWARYIETLDRLEDHLRSIGAMNSSGSVLSLTRSYRTSGQQPTAASH